MASLSSVILKPFNKDSPVHPHSLLWKLTPVCLTESSSISFCWSKKASCARTATFVKRPRWWKRHSSYRLLADLGSLLANIYICRAKWKQKELYLAACESHSFVPSPHWAPTRFLSWVLKGRIRRCGIIGAYMLIHYPSYESVKRGVSGNSPYQSLARMIECQFFQYNILLLTYCVVLSGQTCYGEPAE